MSLSSGSENKVVYQGRYGPWTMEESDRTEVILYRAGIVAAAASLALGSATLLAPDNAVSLAVAQPLYVMGSAGLGLSLFLVHMYVDFLKKTMQALWAMGCGGAILLATNFANGQPIPQFVADHPAAVWAVGPMFAALTGLAFKEGMCYGKFEAGALFFVIPVTLLGHLFGMPENAQQVLLVTWVVLMLVFAGRKFTQRMEDDIGDKSVFMFNALPEAQQMALLAKLAPAERPRGLGEDDSFGEDE
eukprot:jgi/Mesvir1/4489/Mv09573-RA.1